MLSLQDCLRELQTHEQASDWPNLRQARLTLVELHNDSEMASEALYRLGLDDLFRLRDFDGAMAHFEKASTRRHPVWSNAARTSLALCYLHMKRTQKAVFELRKVAFVKQPSMHSVTALALLESLFAKEANADELGRTRKERSQQLQALIAREQPGTARGQYMCQLGLLQMDSGNKPQGRQTLEQALKMGVDVLGAQTHKTVVDALSR